ncbi:MAG: hypothetical protein BWY51_00867 [Parcubacteria group bacterium ADurb.Bin316]|nr:MAG: hypothetical protein BWY51_00867 [Parcubacteria group bacterium ADurb.Bin316]HOZ56486.1 hypothetical protein [bacterium]
MDPISAIKNRNLSYALLLLVAICIGTIFFVNRYFYLFADKNNVADSENFDVASVNIKKLDSSILKTDKFRSLQELGAAASNYKDLDRGKRNPFLPN